MDKISSKNQTFPQNITIPITTRIYNLAIELTDQQYSIHKLENNEHSQNALRVQDMQNLLIQACINLLKTKSTTIISHNGSQAMPVVYGA